MEAVEFFGVSMGRFVDRSGIYPIFFICIGIAFQLCQSLSSAKFADSVEKKKGNLVFSAFFPAAGGRLSRNVIFPPAFNGHLRRMTAVDDILLWSMQKTPMR